MANKCAICGAEINVFQSQKLADGNYICRKTCRTKGMKSFDYVHGDLHQVNAHLAQVEKGTKLWEHFFMPRLKEKDKSTNLKHFSTDLYVAEDIGLVAFTQTNYKFFIFGKSYRACVYRIADLISCDIEKQKVKTSNSTDKKEVIRLSFANSDGLFEFTLSLSGRKEYEHISNYFNKLFGIQKTLGNAVNNWKRQTAAIESVASGISAAVKEADSMEDKAAEASDALDKAIYGDHTELIQKTDAVLAAFGE